MSKERVPAPNVGRHAIRLELPCHQTDREKAFAAVWDEHNDPNNSAMHALSSLLCPASALRQRRITDDMIIDAATLMQWLGSNVGFSMVVEALRRSGYLVTRARHFVFQECRNGDLTRPFLSRLCESHLTQDARHEKARVGAEESTEHPYLVTCAECKASLMRRGVDMARPIKCVFCPFVGNYDQLRAHSAVCDRHPLYASSMKWENLRTSLLGTEEKKEDNDG